MTKFLNAFLRDESGAAAAEYALILGIVGAAIGTAAFALGGEIWEAITRAEAAVNTANTSATNGYTAD